MKKKPRILIGLREIAGSVSGLADAFRRLGYDCDCLIRYPHPFKYCRQSWGSRALQWLCYKTAPPGRRPRRWRGFWIRVAAAFNVLIFCWSLLRYDVFIFYYHTTFFSKWQDLPILKFFGKQLLFVYVGSDARPPYLDGTCDLDIQDLEDLRKLIRLTEEQKKQILHIEKYANYIVNCFFQAHFSSRPFISFHSLGFARAIEPPRVTSSETKSAGPVVILHAPSHPKFKGTARIRAIIEKLRAEGLNIEYRELTKMPNEVVLGHLAECDFVVDQIYSDMPMGGLAAEAAFFGKPTVVGGYCAEVIAKYWPEEDIAPTVFVHPDRVEEAIRRLVLDSGYRRDLGLKVRRFVENRYRPEQVAARFARVLTGDIPDHWWCEVAELEYLGGGGLSLEEVRARVAALIKLGGEEALQLSDKPRLRKLFVDFAAGDGAGRPQVKKNERYG